MEVQDNKNKNKVEIHVLLSIIIDHQNWKTKKYYE